MSIALLSELGFTDSHHSQTHHHGEQEEKGKDGKGDRDQHTDTKMLAPPYLSGQCATRRTATGSRARSLHDHVGPPSATPISIYMTIADLLLGSRGRQWDQGRTAYHI